MAEKTLNTRIVSKHADLATWQNLSVAEKGGNFKLLEGEIAFAKVNTVVPTADGGKLDVPTYLMKVGAKGDDGKLKSFKDLNWVAAPASDVYAWAKAENKPTYAATEIGYTDADGLTTVATAIANLQTAIGSGGSVSELINAAIEELDYTDTETSDGATNGYEVVTAVAQTNGEIAVTKKKLAIKDITGLQTALDNIANTIGGTYSSTKTVASDIESVKNSVNTEKEARESADEGLQDQIDDVKEIANAAAVKATVDSEFETVKKDIVTAQNTANDAKNAIGGTYSSTSTVASDIESVKNSVNTEKEARESADEGLDERITTLEGQITGVTGAMHFAGVKDTLPTDKSSYKNGDVIIVGNKEYVYSDTKQDFVEFGDVDDATQRIGVLESNSATKAELNAHIEAATELIDTKASQTDLNTTNGNITNLTGRVDTAEGEIDTLQIAVGDSNSGLVKDVADLKTSVGNVYTKDAIDGKVEAINNAISEEAKTREDADKTHTDNISALTGRVNTAEGEIDTLQSSMKTVLEESLPNKADKSAFEALQEKVQGIEGDYLTAADTYIFNCGGAE